ncbi:hypothetical protein AVEN_20641-1 [Araneus ventricosus]|uniref:Uncharacterized protein n=1 Tax=Araneus ventricosus TaxID=182803 RepID=A0A4Y2RCD2_ARAVE|nr:hypothetical protein AVEN_20641-1 [Araneus ventricosus]
MFEFRSKYYLMDFDLTFSNLYQTGSSSDPMKEASSDHVLVLEIPGPDTIHFRRAPSFSRIPKSPPLPFNSLFILFIDLLKINKCLDLLESSLVSIKTLLCRDLGVSVRSQNEIVEPGMSHSQLIQAKKAKMRKSTIKRMLISNFNTQGIVQEMFAPRGHKFNQQFQRAVPERL